jgi:cell division protein FtsB
MTAARSSTRYATRSRPLFSRIGLLLLIGLCVLFISSYTNRLMRKAEVEREIVAWEQRIAEAEMHQQELQAELDYVNSPAYIEDVARNQLDMARDGDTVIIVLSEDDDSPDLAGFDESMPAVSDAEDPGSPEEPTWQQWITLLTAEN